MSKKQKSQKTQKTKSQIVAPHSTAAYDSSQLKKRLTDLEKVVTPYKKDLKEGETNVKILEHPKLKMLKSLNFRPNRQTPYKTLVCNHYNITSAANTALSTVTNLTPLSLTESTQFAAVFDEARCLGMRVQVMFNSFNTASSAPTAPVNIAHGIYAYDPSNNGQYSSVQTAMDAQHRVGPACVGAIATGIPIPAREFAMKIRVPRTVDPGFIADLLGSNWVPSSDTGVIVGFLKAYVEPCGAAISSHIAVFIWYEMEFAFRT